MVNYDRVLSYNSWGWTSLWANWLVDFLTGRPQVVRKSNPTSSTYTNSVHRCHPKGVYKSICTYLHMTPNTSAMPFLTLLILGLITKGSVTAYQEIRALLMPPKTIKCIPPYTPSVPKNCHWKSQKVPWYTHDQWPHQKKVFKARVSTVTILINLDPKILTIFCWCTTESIVPDCITVLWKLLHPQPQGSKSVLGKWDLRWVSELSSSTMSGWCPVSLGVCHHWLAKTPSDTGHKLTFDLPLISRLPDFSHARIQSWTCMLKFSFYPGAIKALNNLNKKMWASS